MGKRRVAPERKMEGLGRENVVVADGDGVGRREEVKALMAP